MVERVIDNQDITLSAQDFCAQLNHQLIHLVGFLPVANWALHQNDTAFIVFRDLCDLLDRAGQDKPSWTTRPPRARANVWTRP